jgi:hypothetical protein
MHAKLERDRRQGWIAWCQLGSAPLPAPFRNRHRERQTHDRDVQRREDFAVAEKYIDRHDAEAQPKSAADEPSLAQGDCSVSRPMTISSPVKNAKAAMAKQTIANKSQPTPVFWSSSVAQYITCLD